MPLFQLDKKAPTPIQQLDFPNEKALQNLVEANIGAVFNCRFVASEFSTGAKHAGRIDTLALSEDSNPVIIEYKRVASSELINQSLFYLNWLHDHHGDFEIAAQKTLGASVDIDWSDIRVLCIAPNYKKVRPAGGRNDRRKYRAMGVPTVRQWCVVSGRGISAL